MKKSIWIKISSFAMILCVLMSMLSLTSVTVFAETTNDGFEYEVSGGEVTITNYTGWAEEVVTIPSEIYGKPVVAIGDCAFESCNSLKSITIPAGVTSIGEFVFRYCSSLAEVKVDRNNKVYDSRGNCNAIIETATNTLVAGCGSTIIPEGVENIGGSAFGYCSSLQKFTIPEGVESIGERAFFSCKNLESIAISDSVTGIGDFAFAHCSLLENVTIPKGVERIGDYAFYLCSSLESVVVYEGVESIDDYAFYLCSSLESVTIPESVENIGKKAFAYCDNLSDIYYGGTKEQWDELMEAYYTSSNSKITATVHYEYILETEEDKDVNDELQDGLVTGESDENNDDNSKTKSNLAVIKRIVCIIGIALMSLGVIVGVVVMFVKKKP